MAYCFGCYLDVVALLLCALQYAVKFEVYYLLNVLDGERTEEDRLINAIQELWRESPL